MKYISVRGKFLYKILNTEGKAKRAEFHTRHGVIQTPVFMNVATCGAIKGALSAIDLKKINCQVVLSNTYHLHLRPGDDLINDLGGLHKFINWQGPILTDSGGFQVFSLSKTRKIKEEGVYFNSLIDGRKIFMGPEESMIIQSNLDSTIAMAFDECTPFPCERSYMQSSVDRTVRWLVRSKNKLSELNHERDRKQLLFAINQGGVFKDIRIEHAKNISELDLDGYAIGGETDDTLGLYDIVDCVTDYLPKNKPTYLMGVGTPEDILECVARGVDFFDCVLPARNGRHARVYTNFGKLNLNNVKYIKQDTAIDSSCECETCKNFSRAYIHHLFKAKEMLAMRLCVLHNLYFFNNMMLEIRQALDNNSFMIYKKKKLECFNTQG